MPNITLSVEKEIIKKVRKIAIDMDTTLTAMVRDFLRSVAGRDMQEKKGMPKSCQKLSCATAEIWVSVPGKERSFMTGLDFFDTKSSYMSIFFQETTSLSHLYLPFIFKASS